MSIKPLFMNKSAVVIDKQALLEIYEHYNPEIFRYAVRMLGDSNLAEDCVADTFLRLLIAVHGGVLLGNIRAYLYRIAHNWIIDHFRRHPQVEFSEDDVQVNSENSPSHLVAQKAEAQRLRSALLNLSAEQRQVIELRFMENWSHDEVAEALGKSVDATRALQYRAVEALRQALAE
jgi:RNA polymerase sigma-70 factor (ECF subfamily)